MKFVEICHEFIGIQSLYYMLGTIQICLIITLDLFVFIKVIEIGLDQT